MMKDDEGWSWQRMQESFPSPTDYGFTFSNGSFSFWVPLGARQPTMSRRMDYPDATHADLSSSSFITHGHRPI